MISRTQEAILEKLNDYVVYVIDNAILGCGALHPYENDSAEIAAVAVAANYRKSGVGDAVVRHLLSAAKIRGYKKSFIDYSSTRLVLSIWF